MGQIILYNVILSRPPAGVINVSVYYRREDQYSYTLHGAFPINPDGTFVTPVIIPTDDLRWYVLKVETDCMPCFLEKRVFSATATTTIPCCAPEITAVQLQVTHTAVITWVGKGHVCAEDENGYNTGYVAYTHRARLVDGVLDGYIEINSAGPNYVPGQLDYVACPLPRFGWAGLDPICIQNASFQNTGVKHYQNRARLVNGIPDGYTEPNTPGINYVPDVLDTVGCPVAAITWQGTMPVCATEGGYNTGFQEYTSRARLVNGIPDGYHEFNTPGPNYVPGVYNPAACPIPIFGWQGKDPVCVLDASGYNTGMAHYQNRERLFNGVPDGFIEPNNPGPNYVADVANPGLCPMPVITWIGNTPYCLTTSVAMGDTNTGMQGFTYLERVVNGVPDGYLVPNEVGNPNYIPPVLNTEACPLPMITWRGANSYCEQYLGENTGVLAFADRDRLNHDIWDGYTEPNLPGTNYIPPVIDTVACPPPGGTTTVPPTTTTVPATTTVPPTTTTVPATTTAPTITWEGIDPFCETDLACATDYYPSPDGSGCTKETILAATITGEPITITNFGRVTAGMNTRIYNPGFFFSSLGSPTPPAGDIFATMTGAYWGNPGATTTDGATNRCGIDFTSVIGTYATYSITLNNTGAQRQIYVGMWGFETFKFKVNNALIAEGATPSNIYFETFHIVPVMLMPGINIFNLEIWRSSGAGAGALCGMIGYDNTREQIRDATSDAALNILFNSKSIVGAAGYPVATCPLGWNLSLGPTVCKQLAFGSPGTVYTGTQAYATRRRLINGVPDGYTEPNTAGPNYIEPISNTEECPIGPVG